MGKSLWLPFGMGIAFYILQAAAVIAVPETVQLSTSRSERPSDPEPLEINRQRCASTSDSSNERVLTSEASNSQIYVKIPVKALKTMKMKVGRLLALPNISTCLWLFLSKRIAFQSENLFYQYASEKFDLKLQSTPSFRLALSSGAFLVTAMILPTLTVGLRRLSIRHQHIELGVIRISFTLMAITFLGAWSAPDSVLFGIGKSSPIAETFHRSS